MTHKDDEMEHVVWAIAEPSGRCEFCGEVKETRPYGPNGEQVCFKCGMKDEEAAKAQFGKMFE